MRQRRRPPSLKEQPLAARTVSTSQAVMQVPSKKTSTTKKTMANGFAMVRPALKTVVRAEWSILICTWVPKGGHAPTKTATSICAICASAGSSIARRIRCLMVGLSRTPPRSQRRTLPVTNHISPLVHIMSRLMLLSESI